MPFSVDKLNGDNYEIWKYKIELLLIKDGVWSVIRDPKPEVPDETWLKNDDLARATIGLLVEDNQLVHIRKAVHAKKAWESLKNYHQKATLSSKVFLLKRVCRMTLAEGGNAEKHVTEMLDLVNKLAGLGENLKDNLIAAMLLSSLPDSYGALITGLESRSEEDLTLDLVKSKVIDEYKRRKSNGAISMENNETAMKSQPKVGKSKASTTCFFCKKAGHIKKDCTKYQEWKQRQEKTKVCKATEDHDRCAMVQTHALMRTIEDVCAVARSDAKSRKWYLDSGATSHMACVKDFFVSLDLNRKGHVSLADEKVVVEIQGV